MLLAADRWFWDRSPPGTRVEVATIAPLLMSGGGRGWAGSKHLIDGVDGGGGMRKVEGLPLNRGGDDVRVSAW